MLFFFFYQREGIWLIVLPLCKTKYHDTSRTIACMCRNTQGTLMHLFLGNGLVCWEWMIKPLIWVQWSEEREGADSTFESSETPTAILHYYWSLHWDTQHGIDLHTSKSRGKEKHLEYHLGPCTAENAWMHGHKGKRGKGRQKTRDNCSHRHTNHTLKSAALPASLSVCPFIWI